MSHCTVYIIMYIVQCGLGYRLGYGLGYMYKMESGIIRYIRTSKTFSKFRAHTYSVHCTLFILISALRSCAIQLCAQ